MRYSVVLLVPFVIACEQRVPEVTTISRATSGCVDWGRPTWINSIKDVMRRNCLECHSPELGAQPAGSFWAVSPASSTYLFHTWNDAKGHRPSICDAATEGRMPPPESQSAMSEKDLDLITTWCENADAVNPAIVDPYARGSLLPEIEVTAAFWSGSDIQVNYTASDDGSADVAFFYDDDRENFDGTLIDGCLSVGTGLGYLWSSPTVTEDGDYYVYGCVFDGETAACDYSDTSFSLTGTL